MASKNYYYVLVLTPEGAKFVTGINNKEQVSYWDDDKEPKAMPMKMADDIAMGLRCNYHIAYTVKVPYEIGGQPFRYSEGHFEWKWNEEEGENFGNE